MTNIQIKEKGTVTVEDALIALETIPTVHIYLNDIASEITDYIIFPVEITDRRFEMIEECVSSDGLGLFYQVFWYYDRTPFMAKTYWTVEESEGVAEVTDEKYFILNEEMWSQVSDEIGHAVAAYVKETLENNTYYSKIP